MPALRCRHRLASGLVLLALLGCRSYAPSYPATYGSPGYAPVYPSGPATLGPPTVIPPAGTMVPEQDPWPSSGSSGSTTPYPTPAEPFQSPSTPDAWPSGGDAPPFGSSSRRNSSRPADSRLVPDIGYGDPVEPPPARINNTSNPVPDDVFGGNPADENSTPFQTDFSRDNGSAQLEESAEDGPVFADADFGEESAQGLIQPASHQRVVEARESPAALPSPYDFDRKNYRWLRGVVDRDPADGSWHIRYSDSPTQADPHGGQMRLIGNPQLFEKIKPENVVLVEGTIEPEAGSGKSSYRVTQLFGPLVPKSQ